jgi:predicted RecA/RadA family phage recombinase
MKAEYINRGDNIDYVNPTEETIDAGTIVTLGEICGVAACRIGAGDLGTLATRGVWAIPKDTSEITAGAKVYYDAESDTATATAGSSPAIGVAIADAGADAGVVAVRLNG